MALRSFRTPRSRRDKSEAAVRQLQVDYYQNPVLGRKSVGQLLQRPGLMGFSNLVWVSGDWRGLASPFCRLARETPRQLEGEAEFVRQYSDKAMIAAAFAAPDVIAIQVDVTEAMTLYSGAPGKIYHNGGTASQQWMAFDAFRGGATLGQTDPDLVVARNGHYVAAFVAESICLAADGNGWKIDLPAGRTWIGVGIGFESAEVAESRARAALAELRRVGDIEAIRLRLRAEWEALYRKFPFPEYSDPQDESLARNAVWCVYSNLANPEGCLKRPAIIGSKIQYPGVFPWDSAFAAVALKEGDPDLARNQIELYADVLRSSTDGRVGEMSVLHTGGGVQFPLFSWASWKIFQSTRDLNFLRSVYQPLAKHARWWLSHEMACDEIPVYNRVVCLDDSPRFDLFAAEGRMSLQGKVYGADLIALCAWDHLHLAAMADVLRLSGETDAHRQTALRLRRFMDENLYDEELGRYVDVESHSGRKGTVNTPLSHFPAFLSHFADRRDRAARALSPDGPFWGRFGLATVSPEETSFDPCRIWRGPIWLSVNMLCAQACSEMGRVDLADRIAESSIAVIRANAPLPRGIMEYFNYQTGEGSGAHHVATMSAAPYLSFLLGHHRDSLRSDLESTDAGGKSTAKVAA